MPSLIINADDFGLTSGVNRAIFELHHNGVLSSTTLMARAKATNEAIKIALDTPTLGVGCHVVLVDGDPILPREQIPTLIDPSTGRFFKTLGAFLKKLIAGCICGEEIEAEAGAQIAFLQKNGVHLTHVDAHKHSHMFPAVLRPILKAAAAHGISKIRNPFEPTWSRHATPGAPFVRRAEVSLLSRLKPTFQKEVCKAGFCTPNGSVGILATGTLNEDTVTSLLNAMPEGSYELVAHPGYNDADLASVRTRLRATREIEREALGSVRIATGITIISFADLQVCETATSYPMAASN